MDVYQTALLCLNSLVFTTPCERSGLCHSMALADYYAVTTTPSMKRSDHRINDEDTYFLVIVDAVTFKN